MTHADKMKAANVRIAKLAQFNKAAVGSPLWLELETELFLANAERSESKLYNVFLFGAFYGCAWANSASEAIAKVIPSNQDQDGYEARQ